MKRELSRVSTCYTCFSFSLSLSDVYATIYAVSWDTSGLSRYWRGLKVSRILIIWNFICRQREIMMVSACILMHLSICFTWLGPRHEAGGGTGHCSSSSSCWPRMRKVTVTTLRCSQDFNGLVWAVARWCCMQQMQIPRRAVSGRQRGQAEV